MIDLELLVAHLVMAAANELREHHSHQCYWWFLCSKVYQDLCRRYLFYGVWPPTEQNDTNNPLRWN